MTETERMLKLVEGYTELGCSKLKKGEGFLKPNFGVGAEPVWLNSSIHVVLSVIFNGRTQHIGRIFIQL